MNATLRISFHGSDPSAALEQRIRRKAAKLDTLGTRVSDCHVTIEGPQGHQRKGNLWSARVELTVPGGELVVSREPGRDHAHEDVHVAVGDAFAAAYRQLADRARDPRGKSERHDPWLLARLVELRREERAGFVELEDGSRVPFDESSLLGEGFDSLAVGRVVRVVLAEGEPAQGPRAIAVSPSGRQPMVM